MKNATHYLSTGLMAVLVFACGFNLSAQNYTWVKKADMPAVNYQAASFTINNKVYVVGGVVSHAQTPVTMNRHVYQYDPATNTWSQMNDAPGTAVYGASSFVIGNYGYIVNGWDSTNSGEGPADCWQYDPGTDTWTAMTPFPGTTRYTCSAFAINGKGYVTLGFKPYTAETWQFDPVANTWTAKAPFLGGARQSCTAFTIGNYAYVGGGNMPSAGWAYFGSDWYRYDAANDVWTQLNYFPGAPSVSEGTFVVDGYAYVVCNANESQYNYANGASNDIWKYDPSSDNWSYWGAFPDTAILGGDHVTCNNLGFFGQGEHYVYGTYSSVWWSFGQQAGPYSCSATISRFYINSATSNYQANGSFSPTALLSWDFGDGTSGTGTSVVHQYPSAGTYVINLTVTDTANGGCSASVTDTVAIANISNCSVTVGSVNVGSYYTLYTNANGYGPYTYVWTADSSFLSTSPDPYVNLLPNTPVSFCVTITDTTGCSASACTQVTYVPSADSCQTYLYIAPDPNIPGLYYGYVYHTGAPAVSYFWDFGDGFGTSTDSLPSYTYAAPGYYKICLTITDSAGCTSTFCDSFFYAFKTGGGEIRKLNGKSGAIPTAIQTISQQLKLSVYPNPASTELIINAAGLKVDRAVIYNVDGQRISETTHPANNKLDISNLTNGIYFMEINVQGQTARVKFVKANN